MTSTDTIPIDLYSLATPNGVKVSAALELIGAKYNAHTINIMKGEQFTPEFIAINPNSKIPAIVDHVRKPDGTVKDINVFESGAILIYLAEKFNRTDLLPGTDEPEKRAEVLSWVMWQMGGLGPMLGQAGHFTKYAPGILKDLSEEDRNVRLQYGRDRYVNEAKRLFGVLDKQLQDKPYVCGDHITIADLAIHPWLLAPVQYYGLGDAFAEFKNVHAYIERVGALDWMQRGKKVCGFE